MANEITVKNLTASSRTAATWAREEFLSKFASLTDAVEFENQALSIGAEFLPHAARDILKAKDEGREFTAHSDYWAWLTDQIEAARN